jgi:ABC-2 type transport system permease protein
MTTFWELTKLSVRRQITYRAATIAGLMTNFFFGLLRASVMVALYGSQQEVFGMTLADAVTYTGLTQASIAYLALFSWYEITLSVKTGHIGAELLRPMNYFTYWMAQDFGRAFVNIITRGLTIVLIYAFFFDITIPETPFQWCAFAVSIGLAWAVSFSWRFLINLAAFWVQDAVGFGRLFFALSWFLSGFLIPLRFLPDWFVKICYLTPLPRMVYTPIEIYLGLLSNQDILTALVSQIFWLVILSILGQAIMRLGVRRLVIQGG